VQPVEAETLRGRFNELNHAITLLEQDAVTQDWQRALLSLSTDSGGHPLLRGFAVRTLYDRGIFSADTAGTHLSRALSRAVPPPDAGHWLDGFLAQGGQLLLHDTDLRTIIDLWLIGLNEEDFVALLPMLRRGFTTLDRTERRRMLDEVRKNSQHLNGDARAAATTSATTGIAADAPGFEAAVPLLLKILGLDRGAAHDSTN
jgi:hypothetical protein